jgi:hypothetical protein
MMPRILHQHPLPSPDQDSSSDSSISLDPEEELPLSLLRLQYSPKKRRKKSRTLETADTFETTDVPPFSFFHINKRLFYVKNLHKYSVDCIDVGRPENSKNKIVSINRYAVSILIQDEESKKQICSTNPAVFQKTNKGTLSTPHTIKKKDKNRKRTLKKFKDC